MRTERRSLGPAPCDALARAAALAVSAAAVGAPAHDEATAATAVPTGM